LLSVFLIEARSSGTGNSVEFETFGAGGLLSEGGVA